LYRRNTYLEDPWISMESYKISITNNGVLYGGNSASSNLQASGALMLTRNYITVCTYSASQVEDFVIDIDGGVWEAKRYVPGNVYGKWHPATDLLVGSDYYGTRGCTTQPWS
jgi:hypothetical protein